MEIPVIKVTLEGQKDKFFEFDEEIMDGVYLANHPKKMKHNKKIFNLKREKSKGEGKIGLNFSKQELVVFVSGEFKHKKDSYSFQFLVVYDVSNMDILQCNHPGLDGLKPTIMDAADLARAENMDDLLKLKRLFN